jgi:NAD(P)-dependent dehydrogenase (short-subunit alcohol dehydrogenase family)
MIFGLRPDETAIVTGGATGIGLVVGRMLAENGVQVGAFHLPTDQLPDGANGIRFITCDVRDEPAVVAAVRELASAWGHIDMLVNNAALLGGAVETEFLDHSTDLFRAVLETNLTGTFIVLREVAREMVARNTPGRIVNVSSVRGHLGAHRSAAYSASKAGVLGLTRSAALALAPHGIRVNAVAPGWISSDVVTPGGNAPSRERFQKDIPLGRPGTPLEAARVIAALLSADSGFVTGSTWDVDGGVRTY